MRSIIPDELPPDGFEIPVSAAFTGIRGLYPLAISHNSAWPRLALSPDHIDMRVVLRRRERYDEIAEVDARAAWYFRGVILDFKGSRFSFSAALPDEWILKSLLEFFARRGLPLSKRAATLLGS